MMTEFGKYGGKEKCRSSVCGELGGRGDDVCNLGVIFDSDFNFHKHIYIYIGECVSVCVGLSFQAYTRRRLWSDRNQIWHTHADSPRKGSGQNKNLPRVT